MALEKVSACAMKKFCSSGKNVNSVGKNLKTIFKKSVQKVPQIGKIKPVKKQSELRMFVDMCEGNGVLALSENFVLKKQRLIQELSKVCDKKVITRISQAQTPEQLAKILAEQEAGYLYKTGNTLMKANLVNQSQSCTLSKAMPLELEQILYAQRIKRGEFILAREKALHVPSKNPQVIAIENILKEQYGVKFVSLKDNEQLAKQILRAFETASKNGVELPKNIAVSNFMFANGENLFNGTILLNSRQPALRKGFTSTDSDFHVPLHEIMHGKQPRLISFNMKKIPERFQEVKRNLSGYSAAAGTHETFTELNTKRLIDGLNPQEQELYNYLNLFG